MRSVRLGVGAALVGVLVAVGFGVFQVVQASEGTLDPELGAWTFTGMRGLASQGLAPLPAMPQAVAGTSQQPLAVTAADDAGKAARDAQAARDAADAALSSLAAKAGQVAQQLAVPKPVTLRIGTFNVLGSNHTGPGGDAKGYASGPARARWTAQVVAQEGADIVGFDEMQADQYYAFMQASPGYVSWPGTSLGGLGVQTNIVWKASRFDLVSASYLNIEFLGQQRPMPIVQLRDTVTGRTFYVFNVHNTPVRGSGANSYQGARNAQEAAEIAMISELRGTKTPVFFIGDMNEHADVFCKVTGATDLTSPAGGSSSGGCRPPAVQRVDWIFGNADWSSYVLRRDALVRRATDHTVLFATATIQ